MKIQAISSQKVLEIMGKPVIFDQQSGRLLGIIIG
jgi:hypothetical protein